MGRKLGTIYITPRKNTLEGLIAKEPLGHLLQISHIPEEGRDISIVIRNGTLSIVSDGSYTKEVSPEKSTSALIIEFSATKSRCFGVLRLGNTENDTTPYRAELMGALSRIVATHMIEKRWIVLIGYVQLSM